MVSEISCGRYLEVYLNARDVCIPLFRYIIYGIQTPLYYYGRASPCSIFIARLAKSVFADDSLVMRVIIYYMILGTAGFNPRLWYHSLSHSDRSCCASFNRLGVQLKLRT